MFVRVYKNFQDPKFRLSPFPRAREYEYDVLLMIKN